MTKAATQIEPVLPDAILPVLVQATDWMLTNSAPDGRLMVAPGDFDERSWYDLFALALVYTTKHPANRFYQDGRLADLIRRAGQRLIAWFADKQHVDYDGLWWDTRPDEWIVETWLLTMETLRKAGAAELTVGWDEPLKRTGQTYDRYCRQVDNLRRMTSPNLKISTNHFAYFAADLIHLGQVFGESGWVDRGIDVARKINACQHADGYWPETHGPTTSYNLVSAAALCLCYRYTQLPEFAQTLRRAMDFHSRYTYPDGVCVETIDQRVRYPSLSSFALYAFSDWADGRGWAELRFRESLPLLKTQAGRAHFGRLGYSWLYYRPGPVELPLCASGDYHARLSDMPGGVVRSDPWMIGLSGIASRPRNHHYTMDRQNLLSVWHRDCGLLIGGGGSRDNPQSATFHSRVMNDPTAVVHGITHEDVYVPMDGKMDIDAAGGRLDLEYWGYDARLDVRAVDERTCRIEAFAGTLPANDPVTLNLNVMLDSAKPLVTASGKSLALGDEPIELTAAEAGGWVGQGRWRLDVPAGGKVTYPLVPFNFNKKYIRTQRLAMLSVPVTNRAAVVTLKVE